VETKQVELWPLVIKAKDQRVTQGLFKAVEAKEVITSLFNINFTNLTKWIFLGFGNGLASNAKTYNYGIASANGDQFSVRTHLQDMEV
jgi:hypothetical protein